MEDHRRTSMLLWVFLVMSPFLYIFQGISFSDEGNALTIYQNIFTNPELISHTLGIIGTAVVGGWWNNLYPEYGLLGFRFLGGIVQVFSLIVAYRLFSLFIVNNKIVLFSLLLGNLFFYGFFSVHAFNYNIMSVFLWVILIYLLALHSRTPLGGYLVVFGVVAVLAIFVRLPNILSLIMLPAYLYMNRMIGGAWRTDMVLFSMSFVVSALSVVALMWNTGYLDLYISSIQFLYQSTELNHGPYNKYQLLVDYFHGYWVLCYSFLQMSAMLSISAYALMCIGRRSIVVSIVLGVFGGCLYYYLYPVVGIPVSGRMMSFVVVVGVFCLIYFLYYYTEPSLKKIVSVLMLLWIAVSPLGSGAGFVNHVYIIPFLFPMMAELLRIKALKGDGISLGDHAGDSISEHRISKFLVYKYMQKKIWSLDLVCKKEQAQQNMMSFKGAVVNNGFHFYFIGLVVMLIAIGSYSFTHDSTHERDKLTYSFDHEFMKGVYSTEENASSLNSLIMELSSVVKKGDVVYIPWGNPLIYYLTETKPFLKHPWSDIYSEDQLVNYYHTLCPPKVMVTYGYSDYAALIGDFARDNRYKKSWYNHDYTIYVRDEHSCDV